jgi:hypothetical protein
MPVWVWPLAATILTAVFAWIAYGKLAFLLAEIGQAVKATGDFLEEFARAWEDKKLSAEETEALGAKASVLWKEWKDVIHVFKK